jgi:PAS domain S-box-containing protein
MLLSGEKDVMDQLRSAWLQLKSFVDDQASQRQHYLDFFENAEAAYLVTDRDGRIVEANGAAVDLFDRRRHYLKGKPLAAFVAPDERREFRRQLQGISRPVQWRSCFATQGRQFEVELRARPMPEARGIVWSLHPAR